MSAQPTPEGPYDLVGATDGEPLLSGPGAIEIDALLEQNFTGKEHLGLNIAFAQGQASSAKEIEGWIADRDNWIKRYESAIAERDQFKARWDELKSFFTHEEHPILPNRSEIKRKIAELEKQ